MSESEFATVKQQVETISKFVSELSVKVDAIQSPKPFNWLAICGFSLAAACLLLAYGSMWVSMTLKPIEVRLESQSVRSEKLEEKLEREIADVRTWEKERERLKRSESDARRKLKESKQ